MYTNVQADSVVRKEVYRPEHATKHRNSINEKALIHIKTVSEVFEDAELRGRLMVTQPCGRTIVERDTWAASVNHQLRSEIDAILSDMPDFSIEQLRDAWLLLGTLVFFSQHGCRDVSLTTKKINGLNDIYIRGTNAEQKEFKVPYKTCTSRWDKAVNC